MDLTAEPSCSLPGVFKQWIRQKNKNQNVFWLLVVASYVLFF